MKILIADDSRKMRSMLKLFLDDYADEFVECADGNDAVEQYTLTHPDVVLMDFEMNQTDGITATREIIAADPFAKIIMVTQHKSDSLKDLARKAGARGFVVKDDLMKLHDELLAVC